MADTNVSTSSAEAVKRKLAADGIANPRELFPTLLRMLDPSRQSARDTAHVWSQPPPEGFVVRGKNYLNDRVKIKPNKMQYTLLGIDFVLCTNGRTRNDSFVDVAKVEYLSLPRARARGFDGFVFLINFVVSFGNFICYWTPTRNFEAAANSHSPSPLSHHMNPPTHPANSNGSASNPKRNGVILAATSQSSFSASSSSQSHSYSYSASSVSSVSISASSASVSSSKQLPSSSPEANGSTASAAPKLKPYLTGHPRFDPLMEQFVEGDDDFRNSRLKIIPVCVEGNYFLRNFVGRPAIVCNKIDTDWSRDLSPEGNFLEADIFISSSSMALTILGLVRHYIHSVAVDMAFTIEGKTPQELPEELMCGIRFHHMDPDRGHRKEDLEQAWEAREERKQVTLPPRGHPQAASPEASTSASAKSQGTPSAATPATQNGSATKPAALTSGILDDELDELLD